MRTINTFALAPCFTEEAKREQERILAYLRDQYPEIRQTVPSVADLILVFGGDGTLLQAIRSLRPLQAKILAFKVGLEGFLTSVRDPADFVRTLDRAIAGTLTDLRVPYMCVEKAGEGRVVFGVNDVLVERTMTWLQLQVNVVTPEGTQTLRETKGSGICVVTAIGSTTPMARQFGCSPIDPKLPALYVRVTNDVQTSHGFFVSGKEARLQIRLLRTEKNPGIPNERHREPELFVDGHFVDDMRDRDQVEISFGESPCTVLRLPEDGHWSRVARIG